jgi:HIV Tat-specific factor 1
LRSKLAEWSDNEEEVKEVFAPKKNKWAKYCVVKHAFSVEEINQDPGVILEIKEDMREDAEQYGTVTSVTLFDLEKEGILTVRFREFEAAEKFRNANNGRFYSKRKLDITIPEDRPRFRKSARGEEPDSSDEERLDKVAHT